MNSIGSELQTPPGPATSSGPSGVAPWFVYLVRCKDGSLYCGIARNVIKRMRHHNAGSGAKYTRSRRPVELAASTGPFDHSTALRIERHIKKLPRDRKIAYLVSVGPDRI